MNDEPWQERVASLKSRVERRFEAEHGACGSDVRRLAELSGTMFAVRDGFAGLKLGDEEGLRKVAELGGFVFDASLGRWRERGRSV